VHAVAGGGLGDGVAARAPLNTAVSVPAPPSMLWLLSPSVMMSLPLPASTDRLLPPPLIMTLSLPAPLAMVHGLLPPRPG
jgi:hypothetical protein